MSADEAPPSGTALVERALEHTVRSIIARCAGVHVDWTRPGTRHHGLRVGPIGVSVRGVLVERASTINLWTIHRGLRRMFETPELDTDDWFHAVVAVVSASPPLHTWWSEELLPSFEILVANRRHGGLAIVPATMTEHGPHVDRVAGLPSRYELDALVESASRHLVTCVVRGDSVVIGSSTIELTTQERALLGTLASLAGDEVSIDASINDLIQNPTQTDAMRHTIKRLVMKLEKNGGRGILVRRRGGVRVVRRLRLAT